ncbi:MAG: leucine-rich repeat protein, partial [Oscillospiraceae bacterium]|nr:leucine-rich repeat protein [Oscillospiraceae bacterium]
MKRTKHLLILLLTLALLLCAMTFGASAYEVISGTCGDSATWSLDSDGTLTVSGTGSFAFSWGGDNFTGLLQAKNQVTSVVIKDGITEIGDGAFSNINTPIKVTIPRSVTSIGSSAFSGCNNLTEVIGGSGLTSIGPYAFAGCENLTSLTIPAGAEVRSGAFNSCFGLADDQGLIVVSHVLYGCVDYDIADVAVPSGVTRIHGGAFSESTLAYTSLRTVTIPEGVTTIESGAFRNLINLEQVTIPASVTQMGGDAFRFAPLGGEKANSDLTITFKGSAPFASDGRYFYGRSGTIYYPAGNSSWANASALISGDFTLVPVGTPAVTAGWKQNSTGWWYQNADGTYPAAKWQQIGGKWYHFDKSGYMQTGWLKDGSTWYYLSSGGAMQTGWQKVGGTWYYLNSSGAMLTGWQQIGGSWYYMNSSGAMQSGWVKSGGTWYYLTDSG